MHLSYMNEAQEERIGTAFLKASLGVYTAWCLVRIIIVALFTVLVTSMI